MDWHDLSVPGTTLNGLQAARLEGELEDEPAGICLGSETGTKLVLHCPWNFAAQLR